MATILRDWSYRYQWLYDSISWLAALSVGGEARLRQLPLQNLQLTPEMQVLDLCCGSGQATKVLVERCSLSAGRSPTPNVTGLDASPLSLKRARQNVPQAKYIEAFAEAMPFPDNQFDLVHTSAALHEMDPAQLQQILKEVYRVLKPGGIFTLVDIHAPNNPLMWAGLSVFMVLFETETAWQLIRTDLPETIRAVGFRIVNQALHAGNSLQVIQAEKV